MFISLKNTPLYNLFRFLALAILWIILVQSFTFPSNMNISNILDPNGDINAKPIPKSKNQSSMTYSSLEPVLFEKLYNIKFVPIGI